jgi:hypothetical protein
VRRLALLALVTGCSLAFVEGPRSTTRPGDCTESNTLPIVDAVLGAGALGMGVLGVGGAIACSSSTSPGCSTAVAVTLAVPGVILAVVEGISSVTGFARTARCRAAMSHAD